MTRFGLGLVAPSDTEIVHQPLLGTYVEITFALNEERKYAKGPPPMPTARAMRPRLINQRAELSMFSIDNLSASDIWALLNCAIAANARLIPARADFYSEDVRNCGLETDPDWSPIRHVNIIGWPESDGEQTQIIQKLIKLASIKFPS